MNVSLPAKMYDLVQERVKSGMYSNASEVIRDALRRLDEDQRHEADWKRLTTVLADAQESGRSKLSVSEIADDVMGC